MHCIGRPAGLAKMFFLCTSDTLTGDAAFGGVGVGVGGGIGVGTLFDGGSGVGVGAASVLNPGAQVDRLGPWTPTNSPGPRKTA
jgi:hypothetical protein